MESEEWGAGEWKDAVVGGGRTSDEGSARRVYIEVRYWRCKQFFGVGGEGGRAGGVHNM